MELSKPLLLQSLPINNGNLLIRSWTRKDVDLLAEWPPYPKPHDCFSLSITKCSTEERDSYFSQRDNDPNRLAFIVDHSDQTTIGLLIFSGVDWEKRDMKTMGVRIHPQWCDKGVGTLAMRHLGDWALQQGLDCLRLDVAATNGRAIRCYEKAGFAVTGEFWRDDESLRCINLDLLENIWLKPHVRHQQDMPQIRFCWMERRS